MSMPPPPMPYGTPSKRPSSGSKVLLIVLLAVGIPCLAVVGLAVWGGFKLMDFAKKDIAPLIECEVRFEEARDAVMAYAKDHGGVLPKAETWQDDVKSYFAEINLHGNLSDSPFPTKKAPTDGEWGCQFRDQETGIAFNDKLSGMNLSGIENKQAFILLFEVDRTGRNLHEVYRERDDKTSPKIFGEPRGWFAIPLEGESTNLRGERRKKFNISVDANRKAPSPPDETSGGQ